MITELIVDWVRPTGTYTEEQAKKDHISCGLLYSPDNTLGVNFSEVGNLVRALKWLPPTGTALQSALFGKDTDTGKRITDQTTAISNVLKSTQQLIASVTGTAPTNTTVLKVYQALPNPNDYYGSETIYIAAKVLEAIYNTPFKVDMPAVTSVTAAKKQISVELTTSAGELMCCFYPANVSLQPLFDAIAIPLKFTYMRDNNTVYTVTYSAVAYNDIKNASEPDLRHLIRNFAQHVSSYAVSRIEVNPPISMEEFSK